MQVYKFGGASLKDAENIRRAADIVKNTEDKELLIVISAIGKTTNALEQVTTKYFHKDEKAHELLEDIKTKHFDIIQQLFGNQYPEVYDDINNTFVEIEWVLEDEPQDTFDFIYDQIVSVGELLSSKIVSHYLNFIGITSRWIDARSYIQTDNTYREGRVDWVKTTELVQKSLPTILTKEIAVTQGFIGNTSENFTTTLGREGSDFSASIFANCLDAKGVTVWKDVPGILNADPKLFDDTIKFEQISYTSAIEMTYYGASIIHPKTIKPLQVKKIPLYVKPFLTPNESGTVIKEEDIPETIPSIIVKKQQQLLTISSKDYSFISERHLKVIFEAFAAVNIHANMMQISALGFTVCFNQDDQKSARFNEMLNNQFNLSYKSDLELITIKNANSETIKKHIDFGRVALEQRSKKDVQFVVS